MRELPYEVVIHKSRQRDAERWCRENLGPRWEVTGNRDGIWCCFWEGFRGEHAGKYRYYFANEGDTIMFILRWA